MPLQKIRQGESVCDLERVRTNLTTGLAKEAGPTRKVPRGSLRTLLAVSSDNTNAGARATKAIRSRDAIAKDGRHATIEMATSINLQEMLHCFTSFEGVSAFHDFAPGAKYDDRLEMHYYFDRCAVSAGSARACTKFGSRDCKAHTAGA